MPLRQSLFATAMVFAVLLGGCAQAPHKRHAAGAPAVLPGLLEIAAVNGRVGAYLHALARYTSVPAAVVLDGLRQPATDWLAIAHPEMFTSEAPSSHDGDGAQFTR